MGNHSFRITTWRSKIGLFVLPESSDLPATFFDPNAGPNDMIELGVKQNIVTDITVSQLIFSGSYFVGLQASKVYYGLTTQNKEKTKQDAIETVINTYNMIQLAEESKKILAQNLEISTKHYTKFLK